MEKVINLILTKLDKKADDIAKKKHGKSPQITYYELIEGIIKFNSAKETQEYLGIAEQTFNRTVSRCFNVKLNGGGETWSYYLLSLVDYKRCPKCKTIKNSFEYYNSSHIKHCKQCHSIKNKEYYAERKDIWDIYYDKNKSDYLARNAQRRAKVKQATPAWANLKKIKDFYANCPVGYHVDHIIPLNGDTVCGFHVENNLQYLTEEENLKKSNKLITD